VRAAVAASPTIARWGSFAQTTRLANLRRRSSVAAVQTPVSKTADALGGETSVCPFQPRPARRAIGVRPTVVARSKTTSALPLRLRIAASFAQAWGAARSRMALVLPVRPRIASSPKRASAPSAVVRSGAAASAGNSYFGPSFWVGFRPGDGQRRLFPDSHGGRGYLPITASRLGCLRSVVGVDCGYASDAANRLEGFANDQCD
jgi:hypothetical protein